MRERAAALRDIEFRVNRPLRGDGGVFQLPDAPEGEDVALVMHTSGTAGTATAVELTYGNIRVNARGLAQAMGLGDDERWLVPLPLAHVGGMMAVLRSALMATTAVLSAARFDERVTAAQLRDGGITIVSLVPDPAAAAARRRRDARAGAAARAARRRADAARAARSARATPASRSARATG